MAGFKKLIFSVKFNKTKAARIHVYDSETNHLFGSFPATLNDPKAFSGWRTLTSEQQFELSMYIDNLAYALKKLSTNPSLTDFLQIRINAPEKLITALERMYSESEKHHILFNPIDAMFNGLINHMRNTEKKIHAIDRHVRILPAIGIELTSTQAAFTKEKRQYIKKIFKSLLTLPNKHEKLIVASRYFNKETTMSDKVIALVAEGKSKISPWQVSCALIALGSHDASLINKLPPSIFIELWLAPLINADIITTATSAKTLLTKLFVGIDRINTLKGTIDAFMATQQ